MLRLSTHVWSNCFVLSCRGFERVLGATSRFSERVCWVQHSFCCTSHCFNHTSLEFDSFNACLPTRPLLLSSSSPLLSRALKPPAIITVLAKMASQTLTHACIRKSENSVRGEVHTRRDKFSVALSYRGQQESFTDVFNPYDLPIPSSVEQDSNSVFALSTPRTHDYHPGVEACVPVMKLVNKFHVILEGRDQLWLPSLAKPSLAKFG